MTLPRLCAVGDRENTERRSGRPESVSEAVKFNTMRRKRKSRDHNKNKLIIM